MLEVVIMFFSKTLGRVYRPLRHKLRRRFPYLYPQAKDFTNYRKSHRFTDIQMYIYFAIILTAGIVIALGMVINMMLLKKYLAIIIGIAVFVLLFFEIYPRVINLKKRNLLRKRKIKINNKLSKIYYNADLDINRAPNFEFIENVELKKNHYISWEHELKLIALEKNYDAILNVREIDKGYIEAYFCKRVKRDR